MRLIPRETKVQIELFKGVYISDLLVGGFFTAMLLLVITSTIPGRLYIALAVILVAVGLIARIDAEPNYVYLLHMLRHFGYQRKFRRAMTQQEMLEKDASEQQEETLEILFPEQQEESSADLRARLQQLKQQDKELQAAQKREWKQDNRLLKSRKTSDEEKDAIWRKRVEQEAARKERAQQKKQLKARIRGKHADVEAGSRDIKEMMPFTDIKDGFIVYGGRYYGAAIEIPPVEFRFFSESRRNNAIENALGRVLRAVPADYAANIVKLERPVQYESYLENEYQKLEDLRSGYENGAITEDELKARVEVLYDRIAELQQLCDQDKVIQPCYYLVLFDGDRQQLQNTLAAAMEQLRSGEMEPRRLNDKELAVFLKYTNQIDFDEQEIDRIDPQYYAQWAMPNAMQIKFRTVNVNRIVTHNMRVVGYPSVVGDSWLASVMSMPATKVVVKCKPMDRTKAVRGIDNSLTELRAQYAATNVDSKRLELAEHVQTLSELLSLLQGDNETLMEMNIYVTAYDIALTRHSPKLPQPPRSVLANINNMKRTVRRTYQEQGLRLNNMEFDQTNAFIGGQISAWDPLTGKGRGVPSNSIAACFPWIFAHVADKNGIKLGTESGVPVMIDFFRRDSERVNSNMVIVGKSGSGKSYATKSLLTNLAADDAKIFILDPENEYTELAGNLHGKFINVGNAQHGRLNPFHIITALDDDETEGGSAGSYATHLQFLEEFFRQIMPDCDKDAMEYLNSLVDRMYADMGITPETDLSRLRPEDYPVFDDLYDTILMEFQKSDNQYIHTMLRTLTNYIGKFSTGGRNANIWNGPSTVTTESNFTVFNFQSLLANRNGAIANAQMLLVLKYVDNEIIKNRDYNTKYNQHRKVVVVIDEAHVFIDAKYPVALDFMFQLAKRIRKYNGMQIVITQNIKDFVGSEEIARKSTAIINACQYSFIFSLSPNDMGDLCTLYEKAGGINEQEQEQIITAPRGQAFTIMSPQSRSTFKVEVPEDVVAMFQERGYISRYFRDEDGEAAWEEFVGDSRQTRALLEAQRPAPEAPTTVQRARVGSPVVVEMSREEYEAAQREKLAAKVAARLEQPALPQETPRPAPQPVEIDELDLDDIPEIPDDPAEFARMMAEAKANTAADEDELDLAALLEEEPTPTPAPQPVAVRPAPQPAPQPVVQTVVQAEAVHPAVLQLLDRITESQRTMTSLMERLVSDTVRKEVQTILREEMPAAAPNFAAQPAQPQPVDYAAPAADTAAEDDLDAALAGLLDDFELEQEQERAPAAASLGSIFNEDALREAARLDAEEDDDLLDDDVGLDDLLDAAAQEVEENLPVFEMMRRYGESVMKITFEQLTQYTQEH